MSSENPKSILFIEDDQEFAGIVSSYLKKRGLAVTGVSTGKRGLEKLKTHSFDLLILDLNLPDQDGLILCQKIRKKNIIPILVLTAKAATANKVRGLDLGADDYLVKPVSLKELAIRIDRLLERNLKGKFRSSVFQFNNIKFDTVNGIIRANSKSVKLTKKEKVVLEYLLLKRDQALSRMEIMDHVWGEQINPFSNTLNMVISSLRKKLGQLSKNKFIRSIHGLGYKFETNGQIFR